MTFSSAAQQKVALKTLQIRYPCNRMYSSICYNQSKEQFKNELRETMSKNDNDLIDGIIIGTVISEQKQREREEAQRRSQNHLDPPKNRAEAIGYLVGIVISILIIVIAYIWLA